MAVNCYITRLVELIKGIPICAGSADRAEICVAVVIDLHPMIIGIRNIDVSTYVHENAVRCMKVGVIRTNGTGHAQCSYINPAVIKDLDAVVPGIRDVNISIGSNCDTTWVLKLIISGTPSCAKCGLISPRTTEDLYAVVVMIRNVDLAITVNSYTSWSTEVGVIISGDPSFSHRPLRRTVAS